MTFHSISPIQQGLIVGATHGNEFTGAYVIKKLEQYLNCDRRSTFETLTLLANPRLLLSHADIWTQILIVVFDNRICKT